MWVFIFLNVTIAVLGANCRICTKREFITEIDLFILISLLAWQYPSSIFHYILM